MISPDAPVFVALGSNIAPEYHLARAVQRLAMSCELLGVSSVYRTPPQGFADQADFLNLAVMLRTPLGPADFKRQVLDTIERELGRQRDPHNKNAPRTIDLDIVLWGDAVLEYGDKPWRIPDPDILRFAHVALPLAELAPDQLHPVERTPLREIAARFQAQFERFPLAW